MEQAGEFAISLGVWIGYAFWVLLMLSSIFTIFISIPGGWIALGLAVVYDLIWGFSAIGWPGLVVFAALLALGEVIESLLGTLYVAKKGATAWGVIGAFVGGIAGAIAGSGVVPLVGTILGSFAGAFAGAVLGEYLRNEQLQPSMRVGFHALVGRVIASTVKLGLSLVGAMTVAVLAWPRGAL